jgi:hypothetical protein
MKTKIKRILGNKYTVLPKKEEFKQMGFLETIFYIVNGPKKSNEKTIEATYNPQKENK